MKRVARRGNAMVEFTLVAIPLLFILVSTVEMARGMWAYHSLANAVRGAARYAVVHGSDCSAGSNVCSVTVAQVVSNFEAAGTGLPTNSTDLTLTLTTQSGSITCNPVSSCASNSTVWPPASGASPGSSINVSAVYHFRSSWSIMTPGSGGSLLISPNLSASSTQVVQF
jgi:Flp pilus assembly protein TadG